MVRKKGHRDLGHTVDSNVRYSSNHCFGVSFCSVVARTGGGAAGWEQVDAPAPQALPEPPPGEKLLWAGPGAEPASSTTEEEDNHTGSSAWCTEQLSSKPSGWHFMVQQKMNRCYTLHSFQLLTAMTDVWKLQDSHQFWKNSKSMLKRSACWIV